MSLGELDDRKRKAVVAVLRPGVTAPEEREVPKEPHHMRQLFWRLKREGRVEAFYEAGVSGYDLHASPLPRVGAGVRRWGNACGGAARCRAARAVGCIGAACAWWQRRGGGDNCAW